MKIIDPLGLMLKQAHELAMSYGYDDIYHAMDALSEERGLKMSMDYFTEITRDYDGGIVLSFTHGMVGRLP